MSIVALTVMWFLVYWIVGGVIFAVFALVRFSRMKKARFSCLFTLASALFGFGAAYTGSLLAESRGTACSVDGRRFLDAVGAMFSCGSHDIFLAGAMGFSLLLLVGIMIMVFSGSAAKHIPAVDSRG